MCWLVNISLVFTFHCMDMPPLTDQRFQRFTPMFLSKSFLDFILKFKSLKTKGLIFIYGVL